MIAGARAALLGAGGHARVLLLSAKLAGIAILCLLDDHVQGSLLNVPIYGPIVRETLDLLSIEWGLVAIGNNRIREQFAHRFEDRLEWVTIIHPNAIISEDVAIGEGTFIDAGAIVQPGSHIGSHVILNTASVVSHNCAISDFAHLAPGVHLAGDVFVGEGAFLGIGSCVIPGIRVGRWAVVGAGAAVIDHVPDYATVVGVPARIIKIEEVTP